MTHLNKTVWVTNLFEDDGWRLCFRKKYNSWWSYEIYTYLPPLGRIR